MTDKLNLNELIKSKKYNYVITVHDKMMSVWRDVPKSYNFYQFIFCKDKKEKDEILEYLEKDETFNYIYFYDLKYKNDIKNLKNKSYKVNYSIKLSFPIAFEK